METEMEILCDLKSTIKKRMNQHREMRMILLRLFDCEIHNPNFSDDWPLNRNCHPVTLGEVRELVLTDEERRRLKCSNRAYLDIIIGNLRGIA
jgi:hypothetical protein